MITMLSPFFGVAYMPSIGALVTLSEEPKILERIPVTAKANPDVLQNAGLAFWGETNDFPQQVEKEIEKNAILSGGLEKKQDLLYSGGLEYGREVIQEGQRYWEAVQDDRYAALLESYETQQYLSQAIHDYVKFRNFFPELAFNGSKSTIVSITAQPAADCRFAVQDPRSGKIPMCYANANWSLGRKLDSEDTLKFAVLDPLFDRPDAIRADSRNYRYIFRPFIPGSRKYYALVPWWSVKTSKWLDVSNAVPLFKKYLMEYQMTIKYHIEVDVKWLSQKYGAKWTDSTDSDKNKILLEELNHFNEMLKGVEKTGRNIITAKWIDETIQKEYSAWSVKPLDASQFSGEYLDDAQEAANHMLWAIGLDPTLGGSTPGKKSGDGSGSNKREANNVEMSTATRHQDILLAPIRWAAAYNGLDPDIKIRFRNPYMQILNQVTPFQRQNTFPDAIQ